MESAKDISKNLGLDRVNQPGPSDPIFFYPKEFYVFDNYSSFQVEYDDHVWPTSEHAYHYAKFKDVAPEVVELIKQARSAHDAQKIAQQYKDLRIENWDDIKVDRMKNILRNKINQHEYVYRKLIETGGRIIIEDSWRDDEWGWGKDKNGENKLGEIWMELREEFKNKKD